MIKNYDLSVEIIRNLNWLYIPDHPHRILIIGGMGKGKINVLLNLIKNINNQIWAKFIRPFESKYQLLINGREKVGIENLKNPETLIIYKQLTIFMKI